MIGRDGVYNGRLSLFRLFRQMDLEKTNDLEKGRCNQPWAVIVVGKWEFSPRTKGSTRLS